MTVRKCFTWKMLVLTLVAYFASTGNAYADNYNFFFTKPPKKKSRQAPEIQEQETQDELENASPLSSDEEQEEKVEREKIEKESLPPTQLTSPNPNHNTQTLNIPNTQQPIIINNTNNVGYPGPVPSPEIQVAPLTRDSYKRETYQIDPQPTYEAPKVSTHILPPYEPKERSSWRMGISAILLMDENTHQYSYSGQTYSYNSKDESFGSLVTLGWDVTKVLGFNFYGGITHIDSPNDYKLHWGSDFQVMPLRIPLRVHDLFELGFLVGASNILSDENNVGAIHVGAKLNININENYGFTAVSRVNPGHVLLEAGFVARI